MLTTNSYQKGIIDWQTANQIDSRQQSRSLEGGLVYFGNDLYQNHPVMENHVKNGWGNSQECSSVDSADDMLT